MTDSYPRLAARTLRFTLGVPRNLAVRGSTVYFVRTADGLDRSGRLWAYSVERDAETLVVDPADHLGGREELSAEERARRERSREGATGIVGYSLDHDGRWAAFTVSGRLFATHLSARITRELAAAGPVIDPHVDPRGRNIAYAANGALRIISIRGDEDRALVSPGSPTEVWGRAEFIAAEEMDRHRGFWWAPDGASLLVEQYDEAPVQTWHIADPAQPASPATAHRYPAAGTPNAVVTLWHVSLDGQRTEVTWDRERFEYLARVSWTEHGDPVLQVLSRDQRLSQVLGVDVTSGRTRVLAEYSDPAWVELTGTPQYAPGGRLVTIEDRDSARRLVVDGAAFTPEDWYVRGVATVEDAGVVVTYSTEPTEVHVARIGWSGEIKQLTQRPGVHSAIAGDDTLVISSLSLVDNDPAIEVRHGALRGRLRVLSESAPFVAAPELVRTGPRSLSAAVLFPRHHTRGIRRLPVLMHPYGGPHAQRVMAAARAYLEPQWLADQGFCVIVADGRGTPGRGPGFERAILDNFADITLQDQVDALHGAAELFPDDIDTSRVGISGWSFGGYLAALAVLRRPDVFHAAVAGAPVTEWRLYDTCYTERYLGDPDERPDVYDRNSLLPLAPLLERPLMIIHGLADDNVVAAHSLQLSSALLAAGRPHTLLPLSGVTHMTPQETVAENLMVLQVDFLQRSLGLKPGAVL